MCESGFGRSQLIQGIQRHVKTEEIQGKHIQGTAGEQQLGPVMHANAAPN